MMRRRQTNRPTDHGKLLFTGLEQYKRGDLAAAGKTFNRYLKKVPDDANALNLMGLVELAAGDMKRAAGRLRKAHRMMPRNASILGNLAVALHGLGQLHDAADKLRKAVALAPENGSLNNDLGKVLYDLGDFDGALASYRTAVELKPELVIAWSNMGWILRTKGLAAEAVTAFEKALDLEPAHVNALNGLALACHDAGETGRADEISRRAVELAPDDPSVLFNLAMMKREEGLVDEAAAAAERALAAAPDDAAAHFSLAVSLLLKGDFERGWDEFEWRWESADFHRPKRFSGAPPWDGSGLAGKTLLILSEDAPGEEMMYSTCFQSLLDDAEPGHVVLECDRRLVGMFGRAYPEFEVVAAEPVAADGSPPERPRHDVQIAIGSLPRLYRRGEADFERPHRLLAAAPDKVDLWRERIDGLGPGLKVGIAWRGGSTGFRRRRRTIPAGDWLGVLRTEGVHFVNLQYGECADDLAALQNVAGIAAHDWPDADPLADLESQAAEIACLDLVIQTSNTSAHLAGILGKPVWTLLPHAPYWAWHTKRDRSLWYPSARLFRQAEAGEWGDVMAVVADELRRLAAAS